MSRWFRHYAGMMRDEKLVGAALRSKQSVERVVWVWGAILESAAEINDGGRYDIDLSEIAYFLRADEADIRAILDALTASGRLAEGSVVKWGDRQFQSDKSATRQAAYRKRKRAGDGASNHLKTSGDVEVTAPSRHRDAPDTESDTDTEDSSGVERVSLVQPAASDLAQAFFAAIGCPDPKDRPSHLYEVGHRCAQWHADGWPPDMIGAVTRKIMDGRPAPPSIKYFEKAFANAFASLNAPAPAGQSTERPVHGKAQPPNRFRDALDKLRDSVEADRRQAAGPGPHRLLSHG